MIARTALASGLLGTLLVTPSAQVDQSRAAAWFQEAAAFDADAVLRAPDRSTYAVPAPSDATGRVLLGPGWRLELVPGWVARPGSRRGDLRVELESLAATVPAPVVARPPAQGSSPVVALLLRMIDAVNAADARAYAAVYASDATITIYGSERLEGRAAIERYEVDLLRAYPGTRLAFFGIWLRGSMAAVHYGVNTPAGTGPATGHEGILFYRFNDKGEIAEERRYLDALTPMAQAGAIRRGSPRRIPELPPEPAIAVAGPAPGGTNSDAVAAGFAALDSNNPTGFLARIADDVVIDEMIMTDVLAGRSGALAWLRTWTAAVSDRRTEITSMMEVGDDVLVETITRGSLTGPIGHLTATGKPFAIHRAAIVRLRKGRIRGITLFTNGRELAQETGQWPLRTGK